MFTASVCNGSEPVLVEVCPGGFRISAKSVNATSLAVIIETLQLLFQ